MRETVISYKTTQKDDSYNYNKDLIEAILCVSTRAPRHTFAVTAELGRKSGRTKHRWCETCVSAPESIGATGMTCYFDVKYDKGDKVELRIAVSHPYISVVEIEAFVVTCVKADNCGGCKDCEKYKTQVCNKYKVHVEFIETQDKYVDFLKLNGVIVEIPDNYRKELEGKATDELEDKLEEFSVSKLNEIKSKHGYICMLD